MQHAYYVTYRKFDVIRETLSTLSIRARAAEQIRIYYRSGTVVRCCIDARQTLRVYSPDGGTFLSEMTSRPPS